MRMGWGKLRTARTIFNFFSCPDLRRERLRTHSNRNRDVMLWWGLVSCDTKRIHLDALSSIVLELDGAALVVVLKHLRWDSPVSRFPSLLRARRWGAGPGKAFATRARARVCVRVLI